METMGLEGQTMICSAKVMAASTSGPGRAVVGPVEAHRPHGDAMVQAHEVVLEGHLGAGRSELDGLVQHQHGAQRVVGGRAAAAPQCAAGPRSRPVTSVRLAPDRNRSVR